LRRGAKADQKFSMMALDGPDLKPLWGRSLKTDATARDFNRNAFVVVDYAYADPGEPIRAGEPLTDKQPPDQNSLGWLALGAAGLFAWRKSRVR
jgi:hypothetical protein